MKSAFVIPVHPPRFWYARGLIESYVRHGITADLFLVFSTQEDLDEFNRLYCIADQYMCIVAEHAGSLKSPVTYKKWYGLKHLLELGGYDYAACIDSETEFTRPADVERAFQEFGQRKTLHSVEVRKLLNAVIKPIAKFFSSCDAAKLRGLMGGLSEYFWFTDIPVYDMACFARFAQRLRIFEPDVEARFCWWDFDYVIYGYYLLLYEGYRLDSMTAALGAFQMHSAAETIISMPPFLRQHFFERTQTMWTLAKVDPAERPPSAFMIFHVDRPGL